MLGNATKWVLRTDSAVDPQYLVKYPQKFGEQETYTEFFINQLGSALGFRMAASGLLRLDGVLAFLTRIFTSPKETLRHGSLVIEDYYKEEKALDRVRRKEEQAFYSIDFVAELLEIFVGEDFDDVFPRFIEMLIFDALIGSMDRHAQNWGVLESLTKPARYRFAPIFDSARALLWSMDEEQVRELSQSTQAFDAHINRARPCLGPKRHHLKNNRCNHFDFVGNLLMLFPGPTESAIRSVPHNVAQKTHALLRRFPFQRVFSNARKQLIVRILSARGDRLREILLKGGAQ
jgi:hypothetical protein